LLFVYRRAVLAQHLQISEDQVYEMARLSKVP
jgi:hypothetical protein